MDLEDKLEFVYGKYRKKFFLFSIVYLTISISILYINRMHSYVSYDRITFESSGSQLHANLYYPAKKLDFQGDYPLIFYVHGIGSRRDLDIRIPIEFTKRGFFVITIDYQGHGESEGSIFDIDDETGKPALAIICSDLLDYLEDKGVYKEKINPGQIGLLGHSLGGLIVLLNVALDNRFNATVTWAGLVDADLNKLDISKEDKKAFEKYHPKNLVDESNPKKLLAIQHRDDEILPYEDNALYLHELTDCKLITITEPLIGGAHNLNSNKVVIETIYWFEKVFFGSKYKNGPIQITYTTNYFLLAMSITAMFLTALSIILYGSKYFKIQFKLDESTLKNLNREIPKKEKKQQRKKIAKYIGIFTAIWAISVLIFRIFGLIVAPVSIILLYYFLKLRHYYKKSKCDRNFDFKELLKNEFKLNIILYSVFCTIVLLVCYGLFTSTYPFAFFIPGNFIFFLLAFSVYPWYLCMELFYRKIVYPELYFIKSPVMKTIIISLLAILTQCILMIFSLPYSIIQPVFATFIVSLAVIIVNSIIYEKTKKFSSVMITSFLIIQIFFGSAITTVLSVNSVINAML